MYVCVCASVRAHVSAVAAKTRRQCWIPWSWSYGQVWAAVSYPLWVLGNELRSSERAASALTTEPFWTARLLCRVPFLLPAIAIVLSLQNKISLLGN